MRNCDDIIDQNLTRISEFCPNLKVLDISRCFITDLGMMQIAEERVVLILRTYIWGVRGLLIRV